MRSTNIINVRVDDNTYEMFNYLCNTYNQHKTKMIGYLIRNKYEEEKTSEISHDIKKNCMVCLCKIVDDIAFVNDEEIKRNVYGEVEKICQILK